MPKPKPQISLAEKPVLSVDECATLLGFSRGSIYKLMASGHLKSIVLQGRRLFPREAVDHMIAKAGDQVTA